MRAALLAAVFLAPAPFIPGAISPAHAQVSVSAEFHDALAPYGRWDHDARWGDVWIPNVSRDWRPYTMGRWAYTDDWGWYWMSDRSEGAWGWVVFHYGRWVYDDDWGWAWIPGNKWAPAWVSWRRGGRYIGWEPLPPEQIVVDYTSQPDYWIFCRASDIIAPDIVNVIVPVRDYDVFFRQTVIVNRTYDFRSYGYAVNTGIEPNVVAAFVGHPIHAFDVRPVVLAGTARIPGAYEVRGQEIREFHVGRRPEFTREALREATRTIGPVDHVPPPHALAAGEHGRLGQNPPLAARGRATLEHPQTQGRGFAPEEQRQGRQPRGNEFGREQGRQQFGGEQGNQFGREQGRERFGRGPENQFGREEGAPRGTERRGRGNQEQRLGRYPQGNEPGRQTGREFGRQPGPGTEGRGGPGREQQRSSRQPQFGQPNRGPQGEQRLGTEGRGRQGPETFETHPPRRLGAGPGETQGRGGNALREHGPGPQAPRFGGVEQRGGGGPQFSGVDHPGGAGPRGGRPGGGAAFARGVPGGAGPRGGAGPGPGGGGPGRHGERR
jgi:hypothetical protein